MERSWGEIRVGEVEEQINNTRTWVYPSRDDWEERVNIYMSDRFFRHMYVDQFNRDWI